MHLIQSSDLLPFVVIAHGRSGSSLLCKALDCHSAITCHGELFHDSAEKRWPVAGRKCALDEDAAAFCDFVFNSPRSGTQRVGFKIFPHHAHANAEQYKFWEYLRAHREIPIIYLERENLFDAYISNQRSIRSGIWHVVDGSNPKEQSFVRQNPGADGILDLNGKGSIPSDHLAPLVVDPYEFISFVNSTRAGLHWAQRYLDFAHREVLSLTYAELQENLEATLERVFLFLDLPFESVGIRFRRLNTVTNDMGVENIEALRDYFRYSFYSIYFEKQAEHTMPGSARASAYK